MAAFIGEFRFGVEERYRTTFPSKWRDLLRAGQPGSAEKADPEAPLTLWLTKGEYGGLWGYTPDEWQRFSRMIISQTEQASLVDHALSDLVHYFLSPAHEVTIDKQGRLLVPETLRAHAGIKLDGEAVWVGAVERVELFSRARWDERCQDLVKRLANGEMKAALDERRIPRR